MIELLNYLDPSAISVLVTSLTAAFVAVAASLVIYWRKFKNKIKKNSDPNKGKDAEQDVRLLDESALADETEQTTDSQTESKEEASESGESND